MTSAFEAHPRPFAVEIAQLRFCGIELLAVTRLRKGQIKPCQRCNGHDNFVAPVPDRRRQLGKNAAHLRPFLQFEFPNLIVELDYWKRFNEQRRARGGLIMNYCLHLSPEFRLQRDDGAAFTLRNDRLLEHGYHLGIAHHAFQFLSNPLACAAQVAAHGA